MRESALVKLNKPQPKFIRGISVTSPTKHNALPRYNYHPQHQSTPTALYLTNPTYKNQNHQQFAFPQINHSRLQSNNQNLYSPKNTIQQYSNQQESNDFQPNLMQQTTYIGKIKHQNISSRYQMPNKFRRQRVHNQFAVSLLIQRNNNQISNSKPNIKNPTQKEKQKHLQNSQMQMNLKHKHISLTKYNKNYKSMLHNSNIVSTSNQMIQSSYPFNPQLINQKKQLIQKIVQSRRIKNKTPTQSTLQNSTQLVKIFENQSYNYPELLDDCTSNKFYINWNTDQSFLFSLYHKYYKDVNPPLHIQLPSFFVAIKIDPNINSNSLQTLSSKLSQALELQYFHSFKKYTNCVIMISKNTTFVYHFSGKIYLGGWKQTKKSGTGMEWKPKQYIYYGHFSDNKRDGLGIMKYSNGSIYFGYWKKGQKICL